MAELTNLKPVIMFDPEQDTRADFKPEKDTKFADKLTAFGKLFEPGGRFAGFETPEALKGYMERNNDKDAQKAKGPYREMWVGLQDGNGQIVGAINQQIFIKQDGSASVQYSYVMSGEIKGADGQDIFTKEQKAEITKKLYVAAAEQTAEFVKEKGGNPAKVATFVVETSPLMVSAKDYAGSESKDTVKHRIEESQERLAKEGFMRLDSRYLEASFENVNGAPVKHYDMFVKLLEGQKTLSAGELRQHLTSYLALSFPPGSDLGNEALKAMNDNLDRLEKTGGTVPLSPPNDHKKLLADIDKNLPPITAANENTPVGELTPALQRIATGHYGEQGIKVRQDILPEAGATIAAREVLREAAKNDKVKDSISVADLKLTGLNPEQLAQKLDVDGNGLSKDDLKKIYAGIDQGIEKSANRDAAVEKLANVLKGAGVTVADYVAPSRENVPQGASQVNKVPGH